MKKLLAFMAAFCIIMPAASAQQKINAGEWTVTEEGSDEGGKFVKETTYRKNVVATSGFWQNWTITAAAGAQFFIGDNDWRAPFGQWIVPAVEIFVNKWISPNFGIGLSVNGYEMKGLYKVQTSCFPPESIAESRARFKTDEFVLHYGGADYYRQKGYFINPQVLAWLDIDNLCAGYNANRIWNIAFYAGGGVIIGFEKDYNNHGATFNAGIMNSFRIWKRLHATLNIRGALVSDSFEHESRAQEPDDLKYIKINVPFDGIFGITAGLNYHFGNPKQKEWTEVIATTKTYAPKELGVSKQELASLRAALEKSENETAQLKARNKELIDNIKDPMDLWYHVQFVIDKWDVSNREMVNLVHIAEIMKSAPNTRFSLCGYADMQTATPPHNKMLSRNRVNQVYNILTKELGVNPNQLERDDKGGVDLMFYKDNVLSRCVIIKTIK